MTDEYSFARGGPIELSDIANDEQLLCLALDYLSMFSSDDDHNEIADHIVLRYILNDFHKQGKETFTEEEVDDAFRDLLAGHVIEGLVTKGLVEVDFSGEEPVYRAIKENDEY